MKKSSLKALVGKKVKLARKSPLDKFGTHQFIRLECYDGMLYRVSSNPLDQEPLRVFNMPVSGVSHLFWRGREVTSVFIVSKSKEVLISMPMSSYIDYLLQNHVAKRIRNMPKRLRELPS